MLPRYQCEILYFISKRPGFTASYAELAEKFGISAVSIADSLSLEMYLDHLVPDRAFRLQAKGRKALAEYDQFLREERRQKADQERQQHALEEERKAREAESRVYEEQSQMVRQEFDLFLDKRQARRSWIQLAVNALFSILLLIVGAVIEYRTDLVAKSVEWLSSLFH